MMLNLSTLRLEDKRKLVKQIIAPVLATLKNRKFDAGEYTVLLGKEIYFKPQSDGLYSIEGVEIDGNLGDPDIQEIRLTVTNVSAMMTIVTSVKTKTYDLATLF